MKQSRWMGLGALAVGVSLLGCAASGEGGEETGASGAKWLAQGSPDTWPINSDCTCPSGVDQTTADQCAFAQRYLSLLYQYGATWNGGTGFGQAPSPGSSGACANADLPPLTASNGWGANGEIVATPSFTVSDTAGFYNANVALEWTPGPDGTNFGMPPVQFFSNGSPYDNYGNNGSFEPINCSTCFR